MGTGARSGDHAVGRGLKLDHEHVPAHRCVQDSDGPAAWSGVNATGHERMRQNWHYRPMPSGSKTTNAGSDGLGLCHCDL